MSGFVVPVEQLFAAADAGQVLAEAVRGISLAAALGSLGAALPGSRLAAQAGQIGQAWTAASTAVADGYAAHATAMTAAAHDYQRIDRSLAEVLTIPPVGTGSPLPGGPPHGGPAAVGGETGGGGG